MTATTATSSYPTDERVAPNSSNLPPATWPSPPANPTPPSEIDAPAIAHNLIASLNAALANRDPAAAADLFLPDPDADPNLEKENAAATAYWRDHLVLSWRLRTVKGRGGIAGFLAECFAKSHNGGTGVVKLAVDETSAFRAPQAMGLRPLGGVQGVGFFVTVAVEGDGDRDGDGSSGAGGESGSESRVGGVGRGVVRAVEVERGVWKIWTLFTTLEGVKGWEERIKGRREMGVGHGGLEGRRGWGERREAEREFAGEGEGPEVLVVGAGQAGLSVAARLKMLGIPTLVIDRNEAVGDNWRKRYRQLVLHDPVWYDHMPYIPFPDSWPVFTPKDKLADWFESYVRTLDLNVWMQSEMVSSSWNDTEKAWTADIRRVRSDGHTETRTFRPKHLIIATGHAGNPYMPSIPGRDSFQGGFIGHSSNFSGAKESGKGKRAVVIGACNSSMDICQDYVENGYDVTMIQRSSTFVITIDSVLKVAVAVLYEEGGPPTEDSDIAVWGWPSEVLKSLQVDLTKIAGERDKETLDGLNRAGFKTDTGPSRGGIFAKYLQRGGGYYIDVGGAKLITDGKIKVKHGQEVVQVLPNGLKLADGSELEADEIVFATGYDNMRTTAKAILGDELPDAVGDVWGWDEEGEMRTIWTNSGHPGLWFHGGNLALCRYNSRLVALQILAKLKGLKDKA